MNTHRLALSVLSLWHFVHNIARMILLTDKSAYLPRRASR